MAIARRSETDAGHEGASAACYETADTKPPKSRKKHELPEREQYKGPHYVPASPAARAAVNDPMPDKALSQEELEKRLSWRLEWIDRYLTPEVLLKKMERTSLKDLGIYMGITMEKLLLMRGQPTAILGTDERKQLDELAPALLREIQRRGLQVNKVIEVNKK